MNKPEDSSITDSERISINGSNNTIGNGNTTTIINLSPEQVAQAQHTLDIYFNCINDLLLKENLRGSTPKDEVRSIARARTLAVLCALDGTRKGQVIWFLYELHLINCDTPIIDLTDADLSYANLAFMNLRHADFSGVKLTGADLQSSNLRDADLSQADLRYANLTKANLLSANLRGANLFESNFEHTNLYNANLCDAILLSTNIQSANLEYANLKGAIFKWATYNSATTWPHSFDPWLAGAILIEEEER